MSQDRQSGAEADRFGREHGIKIMTLLLTGVILISIFRESGCKLLFLKEKKEI
jgi:hypothetical protein